MTEGLPTADFIFLEDSIPHLLGGRPRPGYQQCGVLGMGEGAGSRVTTQQCHPTSCHPTFRFSLKNTEVRLGPALPPAS